MPFKSKAQQGFMFANYPEMAKEWADKTPDISALPEHVKMADGGDVTAGNPASIDPGVQDASASDFLLPYLLAPSGMAEGIGDKLANEAGELTIGRAAPKMEEAAEAASPKVEAFIKGVQKSPNGNEVKIWGVRGDPDEISKLGYGSDPASVPEHILRAKGVLPESVDATTQNAPNPFADGGIVEEAKKVKSDAQKADDIDPVVTAPPTTSTDTPKGYAKGGFPHVTFMEDQTPEGVKETTHLAKSHEEPKMAKGGFLEGLKKGALHKEMGISEDKKIPAKKLEHAADSGNETLRKRAQFAINAKKWHHASEGGAIAKEDPTHEDKMSAIYKAMGIKKYAPGGVATNNDGSDIPNDVDPSQLPGGVPPPPPSGPGLMDWLQNFGNKLVNSPAGQIAGAAMNPVGAATSAIMAASPAIAGAELPPLSTAANALSGGAIPAMAPSPIGDTHQNFINDFNKGPAVPPPSAPLAGTPPPVAAPVTPPSTPSIPAASGMPNLNTIFNQDTSKLTQGVNPEDRQALVNKLQGQQEGLGGIIAQAVSGLGDAIAAKGGKEQHSLQNIFAMNTQQRQEALANFDQARQDRVQKLQLQTQMGDNALKQAAAADAYGTDEHLNQMIGAPKGTMKKDLPTYFQIMSSQVAQQEKNADLYMKAHAQAGTDVDNAIKNSSILGIKPSPAQLQASGSKLADQYYNRAKGNILVKPSDGGQAQWIPAQNLGKAKQMDPNLTVQP